jgi:hypothetical protein
MTMLSLPRIISVFPTLLLIFNLNVYAQDEGMGTAVSPMRLSYADGNVSFRRYGAKDWVGAQVNTPIAVGDSLYVGKDGDLELQMGSRAFVRADDDTQFTLANQTPDFAQFNITSGRVTFDLRVLPAGYSVELDTPNAVFTIDHAGYYRVDVDGDVHFITRRGGRAIVVPAGGQAMSINPSEEIVVQGTAVAQAETYVAPELDQWDRWNYDRSDGLLDAVSQRYIPYGVAGASDLDNYGNWRVVPDYGPVWVPDSVPPGWAPYSTGSWIWDPYYQWTWIDAAPWGWAPFHYGRWVSLGGYWAWAPGPVVRQAVYAPALVAFFNVGPNAAIGFSSAGVGWVALSWGEPVLPWWGRPNFVGRPWWGGWGGPRVVNNVVVRNTTFINVNKIDYDNFRVNNAVNATTHDRFGNGRVRDTPVHVTQTHGWANIHGVLPVRPGPESLVAGAPNGDRPPEAILNRSVMATRMPHEPRLPWRSELPKPDIGATHQRSYVLVPKRAAADLPRPEFGARAGAERSRPNLPPRFGERRREAVPDSSGRAPAGTGSPIGSQPGPNASRTVHAQPATATPQPGTSQHVTREVAPPAVQERERVMQESRRSMASPYAAPEEIRRQARPDLPGKPANRVFRTENERGGQGDRRSSQRQPDNFKEPKHNP